jgi:hypothetical protein
MFRGATGGGDSKVKAPHWTTRLELALAQAQALRVLDKASIARMARSVKPTLSNPSIDRWIQEATTVGRMRRVVRGMYLNQLIFPAAQICEAAVWLRQGAIVSLQTVLGDCGVWNNYTETTTAVVPLSPRYATPSLGRRETDAGIFIFRGIPEAVLESGEHRDRLEPNHSYRRATPEAALLHWLYLARSPRSRMAPPPADLDFDALDGQRLRRLARAMGLLETMQLWESKKCISRIRRVPVD